VCRVRIASLLPSATEWVYALGLEGSLVAVTFECDTPQRARRDARVVVDGLDTAGMAPAEIDALVAARVGAGLPLTSLDDAAMAELGPDVVLTQDLCRVCALPAGEVERALAATGGPARVVTLDPHRLTEVLDGAVDVASAFGVPDAGRALRGRLADRLAAVGAAVAAGPRPRVLVLEWADPPYLAGHWIPDLVTAAGGQPVLARPGGRSVAAGWDQVAAAAAGADVVLVAPCGFGLDDAVVQAREVAQRLPGGPALLAVDAGAVVTRPGPRVVDGVEALAAALHPSSGLPARPELVRPAYR
jgi:iron complex transport system substrate-binding protein